jgi:hypothetical protein
VDGKTYQVVEVIPSPGGPEQKLFIGASGLVEGVEMTTRQGDKASTRTTWLKNIRLDRSTDPKRFAYAPPADFTLHEQPDLNKQLLAVGTDAPDFMLPQPGGGQLSLSDARKGKKAVLINFWFYS